MNLLFISLGCDKNLVDSEVMLGIVEKNGYRIVDSEEDADIIVINTCCFIHDAKEESIQTLLEMAELKKTGRLKGLIAAGCLAQRYQEEIARDVPWVWLVNVDHLYWVRDGLAVAEQKIHPHGHGWSIVNNVDQWSWEM